MIHELRRKLAVSLASLGRKVGTPRSMLRTLETGRLDLNSSTRIQETGKTLEVLRRFLHAEEACAYIRFGDGEVNLLRGRVDRQQGPSRPLQRELRDCFLMTGAGVVKAAPLHSLKYGHEEFMGPGVHLRPNEEVDELLAGCFQFFIGSLIYSPVALHYRLVYHPEEAIQFFKELRRHRPIFVGNEANDPRIVSQLLGAGEFVRTPSRDAYEKIDSIESSVQSALARRGRRFDVVVTASGASSKVLAKRLRESRSGLYLFDSRERN